MMINIENNEGQFYVLEKLKLDEINQLYQKVKSERLEVKISILKISLNSL